MPTGNKQVHGVLYGLIELIDKADWDHRGEVVRLFHHLNGGMFEDWLDNLERGISDEVVNKIERGEELEEYQREEAQAYVYINVVREASNKLREMLHVYPEYPLMRRNYERELGEVIRCAVAKSPEGEMPFFITQNMAKALEKCWEQAEPVPHMWAIVNEGPELKDGMVRYKDVTGRIKETRLGRYLRKRFPSMKDHNLRDVVALTTFSGEVKFTTDMEVIGQLINEVDSCSSDVLVFSEAEDDGFDEGYHPYHVYTEDLGWSVAYSEDINGVATHRALVWQDKELGKKQYVRSYSVDLCSSGFSQRGEAFEQALEDLGFERVDSWEGMEIKAIKLSSNTYVMPYIDGEAQFVSLVGDVFVIEMEGEGDYPADSPEGYLEIDDLRHCRSCGDLKPHAHMTEVSQGESRHRKLMCGRCVRTKCTLAFVGYGVSWVPTDEAVHVVGVNTSGYVWINSLQDLVDRARIIDLIEFPVEVDTKARYVWVNSLRYVLGRGWVLVTGGGTPSENGGLVQICGGIDPTECVDEIDAEDYALVEHVYKQGPWETPRLQYATREWAQQRGLEYVKCSHW